MTSKHIRSFSLTQANSRYLDGVTKGHRSDRVNRAIEHYRGTDGMNVPDLLKNIEALQARLTSKHQKADEIACACQVSDDEAQKMPQHRGGKGSFVHNWLLSLIKRS